MLWLSYNVGRVVLFSVVVVLQCRCPVPVSYTHLEGEAICYVGTNGPDHRSVELTGKKPAEITIKVPADC